MKTNLTKKLGGARLFKHMLRTEVSEVNRKPSMTEPDQVRPLDVLLKNRMKGIPVPFFNGVFSETDTPDISKLDFVEIAQLREDTAIGIDQAKEDYHALTKRMEEIKQLHLKAQAEKAEQKTLPKEELPKEAGK